MDKYEVIIYWSKEDNAFIAEAPELPGCIAHGDTHSKALTNLKSAMKLWIKTAKEFGDTVPEAKGHRLAFAQVYRVDEEGLVRRRSSENKQSTNIVILDLFQNLWF